MSNRTQRVSRVSALFSLTVLLSALMPGWAFAQVDADALLERRAASGGLLRPAVYESDYRVAVQTALAGWAIGALLGGESALEPPRSPAAFPLSTDGAAAAPFRVPPPLDLTPHVIFPLEALVRTDGRATPADYQAVWRDHGVEPGVGAHRPLSHLLSGAFVLGLASPGMPELAARRVLDAYGDRHTEESLIPAIYVAGLAAGAAIETDWHRTRYAAESQIPRPANLPDRLHEMSRAEVRVADISRLQRWIHFAYGVNTSWDSPEFNVLGQILALEHAGPFGRLGLRYTLSQGYDAPTNSACVLGLIGARCGPSAFPAPWREAAPRGLQVRARNLRGFTLHSFPDDIEAATVTAEFPLTQIAEAVARLGRQSLERYGGATLGQGLQAVMVLPWQHNLATNIRQLKQPIGHEGERRVEENSPLADEFERRLREIHEAAIRPDSALDAEALGWLYLDLSAFAAQSRRRLIGHDAMRIADDWHRLLSVTGANLAGWTFRVSLAPENLTPGEVARIDVGLSNRGRPLDEVTIEPLAGGGSLETNRQWVKGPLPTGEEATASYGLKVDREARWGILPARVEFQVSANGNTYRIPLPVEWRIGPPLLWDTELHWDAGNGLALLNLHLLSQPDSAQRDAVKTSVTHTPDGMAAQPEEVYRSLPPDLPSTAVFFVAGLTADTTHAWHEFGLRVEWSDYVRNSTEVLQLGPIRQIDLGPAPVSRAVTTGRRAFVVLDGGRVIYQWDRGARPDSDTAPVLTLDLHHGEAVPAVTMTVTGVGPQPVIRAIPIAAGEGWQSVDLPLDGIRFSGRKARFEFHAEGAPLATGRLRPREGN